MIRFFTILSREPFDLDSGSDIVLAAIHDPGDGGNNEDDAKGGNAVVYFSVSGGL